MVWRTSMTAVTAECRSTTNEPFFVQTVVKIQKEIISGDADGGGGKSVRAARTVRVLEGGDLKLQCEVLPGKTAYDGYE